MTTLAIIFASYCLAQFVLILAACALASRQKNPFRRKANLSGTVRRVHP